MAGTTRVEAYLQSLAPGQRDVAAALRRLIRDVGPSLEEDIKWNRPVFAGRRNVCYLAAEGDHVKLGFFQGARFRDPRGLLEGTGKEMRHVKVRDPEGMDTDALRDLVRQAVLWDGR